MNELLDLEVKERMENERKLSSHIHRLNELDLEVEKRSRADHDLLDIINAVERVLVLVAIILTVGIVVLFNQASKQADEIKLLQEQVQENRESILHQAEVNERQEVILSKLNQEYQMKHYQKGGEEMSLDNVLNELANTLKISNGALKSALSAFGDNYQQIYQNLVREYTMYVIFSRLLFLSIFSSVVLTGIAVVYHVATIDSLSYYTEDEKIDRKKEFRKIFTALVIAIILFIICIISPIFYPNIKLILDFVKN